jgi:hypothetical protein
MIGHKLGEFAPTRTYRGHIADKKAKKFKFKDWFFFLHHDLLKLVKIAPFR